ncbi:hypothetical protein NMG60_11025635 [Bertholletia excelsa]
MWERWCWGKVREGEKEHLLLQHRHALLILGNDDADENDDIHDPTATTTSLVMVLISWLSRRRSRLVFLVLCFPLLLPLLCATFPLLCVAEICLRLCRRSRSRRRQRKSSATAEDQVNVNEGDQVRLLQRYLEDQLLLVVGPVYDCSDDDGFVSLFLEDGDCDGAGIEFLP